VASSVFLNPSAGLTVIGGTTFNFPAGSTVGAGRFLGGDGTAALPTFSFTSAPTYGLFFGAGGLQLSAAGNSILYTTATNWRWAADVALQWSNTASDATASGDTFLARLAAGNVSLQGASGVAGSLSLGTLAGATSTRKLVKAVAAIADATGTAVLTVTIPNAAHSASLKVTLVGSLGAGGAIGANEASGTVSYDIGIARTAGVATVATVSTAYGSAMASVAGAATITVTAVASAMAGAVGATQTFTVNVTITKGSGASANHTCRVLAELINANATGLTIA
jgi:hypothetical protein